MEKPPIHPKEEPALARKRTDYVGRLFSTRSPYPSLLEKYIRRNKITGPRVASVLAQTKEDYDPKLAKETGEKFIKWSMSHEAHNQLASIKWFMAELTKELQEQEALPKDSPPR